MVLSREGLLCFVDHMGSIPVYTTTLVGSRGDWCIGTQLVDVARVAGRGRVDETSIREFAERGAITSPHTAYEDVQRMWPGRILELPPGDAGMPANLEGHSYWRPTRNGSITTDELGDVADATRDAMVENLDWLLGHHPRTTIMFSGGEDSRVIGALASERVPEDGELKAVIFLDALNREYRLADLAARRLSLPLAIRYRAPDHYTRALTELVEDVGPGVDLAHAHSSGLCENLEVDLFLDGFGADILLKAAYLRQRQRSYRGVALGLARARTDAGFADPELDSAVADRVARKAALIESMRPAEDLSSWLEIWPLSDKPAYGFLASNRARLRSASPFLMGNVAQCVSVVPEVQKLNRVFFHRAFGHAMGRSGWVPRSEGQIPRLGPRANLLPAAAVGAAFALHHKVRGHRPGAPSPGPWQTAEVRTRAALTQLAVLPRDAVDRAQELAGYTVKQDSHPSRVLRVAQIAVALDRALLTV
ncbi:MAG: hypothetical protein U5K29_02415 [Acidimicrobiales bacterium]|nr:hypothetical protein [Acidimicrobiales bacterium]